MTNRLAAHARRVGFDLRTDWGVISSAPRRLPEVWRRPGDRELLKGGGLPAPGRVLMAIALERAVFPKIAVKGWPVERCCRAVLTPRMVGTEPCSPCVESIIARPGRPVEGVGAKEGLASHRSLVIP
jgi:hypothetical protein